MKKTILICILICCVLLSNAQDPSFLNSNQSLVYLNPSFAGSNGGIRYQCSYRNQWLNSDAGNKTFVNTFDAFMKPLNGGLAGSWMKNDAFNGIEETNVLSLSYAQYVSFRQGDLKIIPSLQVAYGKRSADYSSLNYGDPQAIPYPYYTDNYDLYPEKQYLDFSSGLLVNYKNKLYVGASFLHMNQPDEGLLGSRKLPIAYNFHTSYNYQLSEKSYLQAFYLINYQSGFRTQRLALNLLSFNHLNTGLACVNWESLLFNAGYRNNYFNLLLGYDFTLSKLAGDYGGSLELHASFNLRNKDQRKTLTSFETW